jgi:hypothetical protein
MRPAPGAAEHAREVAEAVRHRPARTLEEAHRELVGIVGERTGTEDEEDCDG